VWQSQNSQHATLTSDESINFQAFTGIDFWQTFILSLNTQEISKSGVA